MKQKNLKRAILLGLAMSVTAYSMGMAELKIEGPIKDGTYNNTYTQTVTIHSQSGEAAIRLEKDKDEKENLVSIKTSEKSGGDIILQAAGSGIHTTQTDNSVILNADGNNQIYFNTTWNDQSGNYQPSGKDGNGITAKGEMDINLTAHGDNIIRGNNGDGINTESDAYGKIHLEAQNNIITVSDYGIYSKESSSGTDPTTTQEYIAEGGNNQISGGEDGIHVAGNGILSLKAENGQNIIRGGYTATAAFSSDSDKNGSGIYLEKNSGGKVSLEAKANIVEGTEDGIHAESGSVTLTASSGENAVSGDDAGIKNKGGTVSLAGQNNLISGKTGILAEAGTVTLTAEKINYISGDTVDTVIAKTGDAGALSFGDGYAVNASGKNTQVDASAEKNLFSGAVYASGDSSVQIGKKNADGTWSSSELNYVASSAVISDAGDLNTSGNEEMKNKSVISALYAEDGADITVSGQNNIFRTTANPNNSDQLKRVIWAYNGADININGTTVISTDSYETSANSNDIAIAAGTAAGLEKDDVDYAVANPDTIDYAVVTVNYDSYTDDEGNTVASSITGDIVSAYAGQVNIQRKTDAAENAKINITGNLLAGNGGILNVDLGNGGKLTGRIDDYGDAGSTDGDGQITEGHAGTIFFDPAFSSDIYKGGNISLNMGEGSVWDVTGQSWVTSLSGSGIIDMINTEDGNNSSHAVHIRELSGSHTFIMDLNAEDHSISDMLYIYDTVGDGTQTVQFHNITGWENMEDGEKLRFATVNASETELTFSGESNSGMTYLRDLGVNDMSFKIESESVTESEADGYNGEDGLSKDKPGNDLVEENYTQEDSRNWYLIKNSAGDTLSDAGQTVIDMSKVNYSNAVYMDRLNKRMGEARYIDGDDGLWVRIRHDRIGKEDAFRSMNTMMELGYDRKVQSQKDGEHRRGVAFDYMRGTADYTNVMGSGDVRRAGVWLYDTWLGDKGHYTDYVLKYGHLSNDFDIYARTSGNKINGDYNNDVWSASAEYGRKKDIGNEWYFEPQAQMQYAYVTSADYTTSQGTKVELDGIDSLIGRAGFRLGRDTSEGNTVYFKADILHEFLGDQSIRAMDSTGVLSTTYENEGTWYDVGFGFSHRMGRDRYMFLDLERSFGNDNTDTWQVNVGLNWKV